MNSKQRKEWERAVEVAGHMPGNRFDLAPRVAELLSMARRLDRYNEVECNYGVSEAQQKRIANLEKRVTALCGELGISCHFNGDPRGYAVKLHLPDGAYNTWGGKEEGWGI